MKISVTLIQLCVWTIKYCNMSARCNYVLIDSLTHLSAHTHTQMNAGRMSISARLFCIVEC
jgi:hypothetical protein